MRLSLAVATVTRLGLEGGVVGLLEDHVLHERLDNDVLLHDLVLLVLRLATRLELTLMRK